MNNPIRAVIIDDEQHCIDTLLYDIKRYCKDKIEVVGTATDVMAGSSLIKSAKLELIFLDIELPAVSGLDFLEMVDLDQVKLIFCTAHSQYAAPAYKYKAEAYLLKPIDGEELASVVERIYAERQQQDDNQILSNKLRLPDRDGLEFIDHSDIVFCQSENNYARIYLSNGEERLVSKTLKYLEERLPSSSFIRIHNSYIIHLQHLKKYLRADGGQVQLSNGAVLTVSKNYRERLKELLK